MDWYDVPATPAVSAYKVLEKIDDQTVIVNYGTDIGTAVGDALNTLTSNLTPAAGHRFIVKIMINRVVDEEV